MTRPLTPANKTLGRNNWTWQDGLLILAIVSLIVAIIKTASQFSSTFQPELKISTNINELWGFKSPVSTNSGFCVAPTLRAISEYLQHGFPERLFQPLQTALDDGLIRSFPVRSVPVNAKGRLNLPSFLNWVFVSGFTLIVLWSTWEAVLLLRL
jgi:NitT/TauT family transport system permease protein